MAGRNTPALYARKDHPPLQKDKLVFIRFCTETLDAFQVSLTAGSPAAATSLDFNEGGALQPNRLDAEERADSPDMPIMADKDDMGRAW